MCAGVEIEGREKAARIYFPVATAALPVLKRDGSVVMMPWGARREERTAGSGRRWPEGGWARLESIKSGRWDDYDPQPVKIPARSYMEKDNDGKSHWFPLQGGEHLQGLIARIGEERRVYVVTISTPPQYLHIHDRWPRIIGGGEHSGNIHDPRITNEEDA